MSASPTITLERAGKCFGDDWVLRNLTFDVAPGTIVGLIGPSGCGKTTTVRMINGTYRPDEGRVSTLGREPSRLRLAQRQRLGYLPQQPVLFEALTLWENLNFHASINGVRLRRRARLHQALELVGLDGEESKLVSEVSGGMKRRLALAATLLHQPDLIVLDEPTAGIDPILRARFWEHFAELTAQGTTMVITTQYVGEAAGCDVVGLLADGRLLHFASPTELRRAAYGGELLRFVTERPLSGSELTELGELSEVTGPVERIDDTTFGLIVEDGGAAMPVVLRWLDEHDVAVLDSEEVAIDYEEVFIRLVQRDEPSSGESSPGAVEEVAP